MRWTSLISSGHFIQMGKNTPSSQVPPSHGTFFRIDHILGHKSNLIKFKKTEIISSIFSDHTTRLISITRKKTVGNTNTWKLKNMCLDSQQVTEETKNFLATSDNENTTNQNL